MDPVEISQMAQVNAPTRPSLAVPSFVHKSGGGPQRSLSNSRMEVIPERSDTPNREPHEQDHTGPDSAESSTLSDEEESKQRSAESSGTATTMSLRRTNSSRDMQTASSSSRLAALVANVGEEELQGFADQFRALVDQVSRELEESRVSENQDRESHTPPLHRVLDTHTPYMTVDEFGREVPTEEPIAMLGSVIKRMPTIESVGSRELMSLRSATLVSGGGGVGSASVAASSSSSRPHTGATMASFNDAGSVSLASASQPSSRSNSIHRLRTPSELGELVRDALRARAQARPLPPSSSARPGSGGSMSGSGSGCTGGAGSGSGSGSGGSGESAAGLGPSASSRSRSNSLGPNEVLPPVTEHGELGREDLTLPPRRPPRRLGGDVPGVVAGGTVGASEMGEISISRTELARSWASNSPPSATSTTYFTASTSGSMVIGGSGGGSGGGDTGTGSSGGGPQTKTRDDSEPRTLKNAN